MPASPEPLKIDRHTAPLIVDMINDFDFEGGEALLANTRKVVPAIQALRKAMTAMGYPVVFCYCTLASKPMASMVASTLRPCAVSMMAVMKPPSLLKLIGSMSAGLSHGRVVAWRGSPHDRG